MDNENKDFEMESQEMEPDMETGQAVSEAAEEEFDPTLSDEFYNNLEAAISDGKEAPVDDIPELVLGDELFAIDDTAEPSQAAGPAGDFAMEEALFAGVDAALSEQIEQEFGRVEEISSTEEKEPNKFVAGWKAIPTWTKVLVSVILVLLISVGLLFGTVKGRNLVYKAIVGIMFDNWFTEDPNEFNDVTPPPDDITITVTPEPTADPGQDPSATPEPTADPDQNPSGTPEPTADPDQNPSGTPKPTATPVPAITIMDDEDVINILLLGEENIYNAAKGRTDAIILVSINLNGGPLKMVSFMRDLYVQIPGKQDDKINAAYAAGGAKRVVETIENNFGVDVDAYAKVNFAGFENIIDALGGLNLSLTARESEYLNTTKYISKPEERNTVAGMQTMTGAQVLGYCRVRYVPTADGLKNDAGRNYRHRVVLKAIFDQYKVNSISGIPALMTKMKQLKDYVTVSSNLEELAADCLQVIVEKQMFEIETMQFPKNGYYSDASIGGADVIVFYPENISFLQDFLYGEE